MTKEQLEEAKKLAEKHDTAKRHLDYCNQIDPQGDPQYETQGPLWKSALAGLSISEKLIVKTVIHAILTNRFAAAEKAMNDYHA